jgi:hypothetical protein
MGIARDLGAGKRSCGATPFPCQNALWVGCARPLKPRPLFGTLCEAPVIVRNLKHHLLGYFSTGKLIAKGAINTGE